MGVAARPGKSPVDVHTQMAFCRPHMQYDALLAFIYCYTTSIHANGVIRRYLGWNLVERHRNVCIVWFIAIVRHSPKARNLGVRPPSFRNFVLGLDESKLPLAIQRDIEFAMNRRYWKPKRVYQPARINGGHLSSLTAKKISRLPITEPKAASAYSNVKFDEVSEAPISSTSGASRGAIALGIFCEKDVTAI